MPQSTLSQITSLKKLGVFRDYRAGTQDCPKFRRYNLIYGFNGSGKTIISRVLSSLERGFTDSMLPEEGSFEIIMSDGDRIRSGEPLDMLKDRVAVFNIDFIEENIHWKEGTANTVPVSYIGTEQAGMAKQLENTEKEIEKHEGKLEENKKWYEKSENIFKKYKHDCAQNIEKAIGGSRYMATHLEKNYKSYKDDPQNLLGEIEAENLENLARQKTPLGECRLLDSEPVGLASLAGEAKKVLETTLEQVEIEELRLHKVMMTWVREGLDYHQKENLFKCLLCGNELSEARIADLVRSIDEERFKELTESVEETRARVTRARKSFSEMLVPSKNDISEEYRSRFISAAEPLTPLREAGMKIADTLEKLLAKKAKAPNLPVESTELAERIQETEWNDEAFTARLGTVNQVIEDHNLSLDRFEKDREKAIDRLKLHYLACYRKDYEEKEREFSKSKREYETSRTTLKNYEKEREYILERLRQHGPAADAINRLMHRYLGHGEFRLSALEKGYRILRRGEPVKGPLSEGEKTALALCYFLSRLKAKRRNLDEMIVVVDDPISSLDTKALNYAFNLIKSALSDAGQAILLTHNLDFMNEAKKWMKNKKDSTLLFLDVRKKKDEEFRHSTIVEMPEHLKHYESEYHYLFHLVLEFTGNGQGEEYLYLMPNALRKMLELFLAFKLPKAESLGVKIKKTLKKNGKLLDGVRMQALERLAQVESHSDNLDDFTTLPSMTEEETKNAAEALLDLMEALDKAHYDEMIEICGE